VLTRVHARRLAGLAATVLLTACRQTSVAATPVPQVRPGPVQIGPVPFDRPLTERHREWIDRTLGSMTLRERVGQMVMIWVLGDYASTDDSSMVRVSEAVTRDGVGGVVMSLGSPVEVASKLNWLQARAKVPLLVGSDVEPGLGRLEGGHFSPQLWSAGSATVLPSNMAIGASRRDTNAFLAGRITGIESRAIGIHVAFAPTVDVNNNPANPVINTRSFGEVPDDVARMGAAFSRGVQSAGVAATLKHFPGHGDTNVDSHLGLPTLTIDRARFTRVELVPFRAAIDAGAAAVMTAHIALPKVTGDSIPATLSPAIMTRLLRDSLHFRGLTFSDALTMEGVAGGYGVGESAVRAVAAGVDVLLMPVNTRQAIDAVVAAVETKRLSPAMVDESVRRILEMKLRTGAIARPLVPLDSLRELVGSASHQATADAIAADGITLLRDREQLVPGRAESTFVIRAVPENDLAAGDAFADEMRRQTRVVQSVRISSATGREVLERIATDAMKARRIVLYSFTRTLEGTGRIAIATSLAEFIDRLAGTGRLVVVAGGNPYQLKQMPRVGSYLVTFGRGDALERAAARAVTGRSAIRGRSPVSLPGFFVAGDGLARAATGATR
jgi:beta-N-acetylhexosaminidase